MRKTLVLAFIIGTLALLVPATGMSGQTSSRAGQRSRRFAVATNAQQPSASPQPIVVPRLTPTPTPSPAQTPLTAPAASSSPSQQEPPASDIVADDEVISVTSNLVVVPVSVTNPQGEPVPGLTTTDFRLEEEGRAQEIAQVGDADQVPLDIALLLDVSSSVSERFEFEQQSAARFLKQVLKPIDRAAIFTIEQKPQMIHALASSDEATAKLLTIPPAKVATGTAFYDSVVSASKYLAKNAPGRHRRVVIVISDGEDNFSDRIRAAVFAEARGEIDKTSAQKQQETLHRKAIGEVLREVQRADAVFYSINPSGQALRLNKISQRAQDGMHQLADSTGGAAFVPEQLKDLDAVFRRIAAELRAQYLVQYLSNSGAAPGKYLTIKVRIPARSDLRIRARQGYYVAGQK